jgi:hypothetical protein
MWSVASPVRANPCHHVLNPFNYNCPKYYMLWSEHWNRVYRRWWEWRRTGCRHLYKNIHSLFEKGLVDMTDSVTYLWKILWNWRWQFVWEVWRQAICQSGRYHGVTSRSHELSPRKCAPVKFGTRLRCGFCMVEWHASSWTGARTAFANGSNIYIYTYIYIYIHIYIYILQNQFTDQTYRKTCVRQSSEWKSQQRQRRQQQQQQQKNIIWERAEPVYSQGTSVGLTITERLAHGHSLPSVSLLSSLLMTNTTG